MGSVKGKMKKQSAKAKSWKSDLDIKPGINTIQQDFTGDEVAAIRKAMKLSGVATKSFALRLNVARAEYVLARHQQQKPTSLQLARQAERIVKLCKKLHDELMIDGRLRRGLGESGLWAQAALEGNSSGSVAVKQACESVEALRRWATAMSRREATRAKLNPRKRGLARDEALHGLIRALAKVYLIHAGREPGLSRDSATGKPGGPFYRLVSKVSEIMGLGLKSEAVANLIHRHGQMKIKFDMVK